MLKKIIFTSMQDLSRLRGVRERADLDGATGPMNSEQDIRHDLEVHRVQEMPAVVCIAQVRRKFLPTVCHLH